MNVECRARKRAPGSTGRWPVAFGGPPNASGVVVRSTHLLQFPRAVFPSETQNAVWGFRRAAGTDRPATCAPQRFA